MTIMDISRWPDEALELIEWQRLEIGRLLSPFRAVDDLDWEYLVSVIPDGGRGRFWKEVLSELRTALIARQTSGDADNGNF